MTAVVRPVSVNHSDFGDSRVSVFRVAEIVLTELNVIEVHSETEFFYKSFKTCVIEHNEVFKFLNGCRDIVVSIEGFYRVERSFTAFDRIYDIIFKLFEFRVCDITGNNIDSCVFNTASFALS